MLVNSCDERGSGRFNQIAALPGLLTDILRSRGNSLAKQGLDKSL